ncbi:MFS transporter [Terrimonas pollutisoli]|uniref:MFS transporter n=1 Tax=Terrimonas pollutisoli TaxID=3034147 RepID=UPI0023EB2CC2|nr:MFS transporter [Terrimonas sp. H1YJ31]
MENAIGKYTKTELSGDGGEIKSAQNSVGKYRWTICALLFFATTVNYLDRQVLSLLQPYLSSPEMFNWTNTDYANITAVFQFGYALSMLFAGRIIDKLGTKNGYAWAIVIWSLAAIIHAAAIPIGEAMSVVLGWFGIVGFSISVMGFMFSRAILAFGEAGNFPAAIKATAEYFPKRERSLATGIFNSGANVGAILAPLTVPWIRLNWGWDWAFIIMGIIGFVWLLFWWIYYEKPQRQKRMSAAELTYISSGEEEKAPEIAEEEKKVSWVKLLQYKQTWAFAFGKFMTDGVWWFFLFWLPAYLKAQYNIVDKAIMLPLAILYTIAMVGSIMGGWFPMYFIRKGYRVYDGRMKAMLMIAFIPLVVLLAQPLGYISYWIPVLLIGIGASAHQAWSANIFTTVSDMFPKKAVGSVVGIGGMAGGIGGVVMSKLGGALFDHYKALGHIETGYTIMFTICAVAYLVAWLVMKSLVPKYKPITDL